LCKTTITYSFTRKEYIVKGFAMDDERLKNGKYFGKDYFKELLERNF
jgi:hypothetical protein